MRKKLPARSMLYAILISLLIAMMIGALIGLNDGQRYLQQKALLDEKLIRNAQSGIQFLLANPEMSFQEKYIDLFEEKKDSVRLELSPWGIFDIATACAFHGQDSFSVAAFIGLAPEGAQDAALYLADGNSPLAVCGKTEIKGKAFLPRSGVKRGNIPNAAYQGTQLIYGATATSDYSLPEFSKEKITRLLKLLEENDFSEAALEDSLFVSFLSPPLLIKGDVLYINKHTLKGKIILIAKQSIHFGPEADVAHIIAIAPKITFEEGFSGCLQAIASDSLQVMPECRFNYPSSLGLLRRKSQAESPCLSIDSFSVVKGLVWMQEMESGPKKTLVHIAKHAVVEGAVWVDGYLSFSGTVWGQVACRKFILQTAASLYENHLLDATIDIGKRDPAFLLPNIMEGNQRKKKGIVEWLY